MRFEDLIDKPLHEMTDEEIQFLIDKLTSDQLRALESKVKKSLRSRKVTTKAKKERSEEFMKALLGGTDAD